MSEIVKDAMQTIPNFPKDGIMFRDITPMLGNPVALQEALQLTLKAVNGQTFNKVAAIEARGFILGGALALELGLGFVPIRKAGKLPGPVIGVDYELEYGTDRLEVQANSFFENESVLLIDDLIATGGTAAAAIKLIRQAGADVLAASFLIDLPDLGGADIIRDLGVEVTSLVSFEGE